MSRDSPGRGWQYAVVVAAMTAMAALAACSDSPTAPPEQTLEGPRVTLFRTDSASYTLLTESYGVTGSIQARLSNSTGESIYLVNCNGDTDVSLEKWIDGRWQLAWAPDVQTCLSEPIIVPAGGTWDTTIDIFAGPRGSNTYPQFEVEESPGSYRLVWHDVLSSFQNQLPFGEPLPLGQRISNTFRLDFAPR